MMRRNVVARLSLVAMGAALALPLTAAGAATPTVVVSGYSAARTDGNWGITESCLDETRGYLTDPASFGPGGVVDVSFQPDATGVDTVTPGSLDGVGVFFTGWVTTTSYTPAERDALLQYVLDGGSVIATTDGTDHDISDLFGLTLADNGTPDGVITNTTHPIASGLFGDVSTFVMSGDIGSYSDIGDGTTVGTNGGGPAIVAIDRGVLGPTAGRVVLVSDVDVFSNAPCGDTDTADNAAVNEVLIKNIFAWAAGVEDAAPTTTTTAAPTTTTVAPTTTAAAAATTTPRFTG